MRRRIAKTSGMWRLMIPLVFVATLSGCVVGTYDVRAPGPPPVIFDSPPYVVHIPSTYVYLVPGLEVDVFFYGGYWYRHYDRYWFRASFYNGPWAPVRRVPRRVHRLPRGSHRHIRPGAEHIPYGQLKKHWKRWEKERHWDKKKRKRHDDERRHERYERHERHDYD